LREANKNKLIKNNTNLIKNILLTYHQEQIIFITKIFNNQAIQELFFENIFNNEDKLFLSKINEKTNPKIEVNNQNTEENNEENENYEENYEENNEENQNTEENNEEITTKKHTTIIYPLLPNSPAENLD
jgi:hypothetical protein